MYFAFLVSVFLGGCKKQEKTEGVKTEEKAPESEKKEEKEDSKKGNTAVEEAGESFSFHDKRPHKRMSVNHGSSKHGRLKDFRKEDLI